MSAIIAVLLVTVCEADMMTCSPLEPWQDKWENVARCQDARPHIMRALEAQVRPDQTVMAKCKLFVDEGFAFGEQLDQNKIAKAPKALF